MTDRKTKLEQQGREALTAHAAECAAAARTRHGRFDLITFGNLLEDRRAVRHPTRLCFDAGLLAPGEFARAVPLGPQPRDGFQLCIHPRFEQRPEDAVLLAAYHLVSINYGSAATREQAEVFGAALLGLEVEEYYNHVCRLADELAASQSAE